VSWLLTAVGVILSLWYLCVMLEPEIGGPTMRVRRPSFRRLRRHEKRALAASARLHAPFFHWDLLSSRWFAQAIDRQERQEAQEKRKRHLWRTVKKQLMAQRYPRWSQPGPFS
jgi:hypothetical protein